MTETAPLRILIVDDEAKDRQRVRRVLKKSSSFEVSELPKFDGRLRAGAKGMDVVCLDVLVDGKTFAAAPAARELRKERRSRAVVCLTNHPDDGGMVKNANFLFEKKEVVLKRLPWFTLAAALHDKGLFLLDEVARQLGDGAPVDAPKPIDVEAVLLEEVRRYYEVLKLAEREPGKDPALEGWSSQLGAGLQPIYEANYCTTADIYRLHEPFMHSLSSLQKSLAAAPGVTVNPSLSDELTGLSSRLDAISRTATVPAVRKFTHVRFPRRCTLGEDTLLLLRIKDNGPNGVLDHDFDEQELIVTVSADGFDIPTATRRLSVPPDEDSDDLEFRVIPRSTGDQYLHVHFYLDTAPVGSLIVHSTVQSAPAIDKSKLV
jgi:hypothetical protein